MPPYCEEHRMHHYNGTECSDMRRSAKVRQDEAVREFRAGQIAANALDKFAYVPGDKLSYSRALDVAKEAALQTMRVAQK